MNDLFMEIKNANLHNFADDNTLSEVAVHEEELIKKLESEACKAIDWLSYNSMIANPDKFHAIILKKKKTDTSDLLIHIKGNEIKTESDVQLLGIAIDNKLSFKKHISNLFKKTGGKLNAIKRLSSLPCQKARRLLINTYVLSHFNYCSTVWHFCGLGDIHKIERINERSLRYIHSDYESEYFDIIKKYNEPTMYVRRLRSMCCEIYKKLQGRNARYMQDLLAVRPSTFLFRDQTKKHSVIIASGLKGHGRGI